MRKIILFLGGQKDSLKEKRPSPFDFFLKEIRRYQEVHHKLMPRN
jgi:hypothetical protein